MPTHAPAFGAFAALTTLATLALLETGRRGARRAEWLLKPLAAAGFVAAALASGALATPFGTAIFVGLCLSFMGDVLLIPRTRATFLLGLGAFLLGHVGYAVAFGWRGVSVGATAAAAASVVVPATLVVRWLLPSVDAKMRPPVLAYVVVISTMVALSIGTFVARGNPWIVVGAIAFYLSDLAVARDRFVAPGFVNKTWGLPLYFGAQLVLAWCAGRP